MGANGSVSFTDKKIAAMKPTAGRYSVHDDSGLYLEVWPSGVKSWRVRYLQNGHRRRINLGRYPGLSLAAAWVKRNELGTAIRAGSSPAEERRNQKQEMLRGLTVKDFGERYLCDVVTRARKDSAPMRGRPQLQAALEYLREGGLLLVHSMDRLARSVDDLRRIVLDLTKKGVHVKFVKENLTFTGEDSPMSNLLLSLLGAVAEFERSMIRERQREGIAIAKKAGVYKGRKPSLTPAQVAEIRKRVVAGEKKARLAAEFRVSRQTLYTALA
jgi:DNA invertase Pin-like site-specific DNA recombinase